MHSSSAELCESTISLPRMGKLRLRDVRTLDRTVSLARQDLDPVCLTLWSKLLPHLSGRAEAGVSHGWSLPWEWAQVWSQHCAAAPCRLLWETPVLEFLCSAR